MRYLLRVTAPVLTLIAVALALVVPGFPARAQRDSSALINEALDKPVAVELKTTLPNALQEIKAKTGVPVELAPGVLDLLPWGEQTHLDVKIANQTLRQAIAAIARTLGLVYVLTPEAVELRPMPALQRLGRRATVEELGVLDLLAASPLAAGGGGGGADNANQRMPINRLLEAVDRRLIELQSKFAVEYRPGASGVKDNQVIAVARNATLADALDAVAKDTPLAWGPWGRSVLVKPKEGWVRDQLDKQITRRFVGQDVGQVLTDLADFSGVEFTIDQGAIQRIPQAARTITLELENQSVRQALETISGFTGLSYVVNEKGVYVWNEAPAFGGAAGSGGGGSQDPVIAMLPIGDAGIQVMIRQSEVPDDVRQYIRHRKGKLIEQLRSLAKDEGFVPTTQPATKPTASEEPRDL